MNTYKPIPCVVRAGHLVLKMSPTGLQSECAHLRLSSCRRRHVCNHLRVEQFLTQTTRLSCPCGSCRSSVFKMFLDSFTPTYESLYKCKSAHARCGHFARLSTGRCKSRERRGVHPLHRQARNCMAVVRVHVYIGSEKNCGVQTELC